MWLSHKGDANDRICKEQHFHSYYRVTTHWHHITLDHTNVDCGSRYLASRRADEAGGHERSYRNLHCMQSDEGPDLLHYRR